MFLVFFFCFFFCFLLFFFVFVFVVVLAPKIGNAPDRQAALHFGIVLSINNAGTSRRANDINENLTCGKCHQKSRTYY